MYKIALYNFNQYDCEIVTTLLERYRDYTDTRMSITHFKSGFDLSMSDNAYHLVFIDLSLNRESSLSIAREFLRKNSYSNVVIISNSIAHFQDGYRLGAERFFVKPLKDDHFFTEIASVFDKITEHLSEIHISDTQDEPTSIDSILYAETDNRRIKFYTHDGILYSRETFAYWHDFFKDTSLILCSRGCLVNLRHIKSVNATTIDLHNGLVIPVSRRLRLGVVKRFLKYVE